MSLTLTLPSFFFKYHRISNWKRQARTLLSMRTRMLHWFATLRANPNPRLFGSARMVNHFTSKAKRKWVRNHLQKYPQKSGKLEKANRGISGALYRLRDFDNKLCVYCSDGVFWRVFGPASCKAERYGCFYVYC